MDELKKHPMQLTIGGIPAVYITVAGEAYIAIKKTDVDAATMRTFTRLTPRLRRLR